jgi:hypothetical protein
MFLGLHFEHDAEIGQYPEFEVFNTGVVILSVGCVTEGAKLYLFFVMFFIDNFPKHSILLKR